VKNLANKKESKPYILQCVKCKSKTIKDISKIGKTKTKFCFCQTCTNSNNHKNRDVHNTLKVKPPEKRTVQKIVGRVKRITKKSVKIQWIK